MKSFIKKKHHKNQGSSFVVVVVALTFIGILALALLSVTLMNYKRMAISRQNDKTYYAVEKAADQLKTGITDIANQALQDAYLKLEPEMKYFDTVDGVYKFIPDDEANRKLKEYFIANMAKALCTELSEADQYNKLCTLINTGDAHLVDPTVAAGLLGSNYDFQVKAISDKDNKIYKVEIKGLLFEANSTSDNLKGYEQNLYTDFTISAPELQIKFNTNQVDSDNFLNYILVANDGFEIEGQGTNRFSTIINGNVYAGVDWDDNDVTFDVDRKNKMNAIKDTVQSKNSGIYVSNAILQVNSSDVVSAGNITADNNAWIEIKDGTVTDYSNQIWCRNLITMASDENKAQSSLTINGNINVYDDLELNSPASTVTLAGEYCGYNYGSFGSDNGGKANSDYEQHFQSLYENMTNTYGKHYNSSSILINGKNSQLDMTGLTRLTVQGKTHVDLGNDTYVMGESISAKGNQLAYSVPNKLLTNVGGYVGIDEKKLAEMGNAGEVIKRLLTSNTGVINYLVYPKTEFTPEAMSGRYFYQFRNDEIPMNIPWDYASGAKQLTADQKAEAFILWYNADLNGYTNNEDFTLYDIKTGRYGSSKVFPVNAIRISDNGDYGKVYSNGAVLVKEDANESALLSVQINNVGAELSTTQQAKINDYNFQLHYLRGVTAGDPPEAAATTLSPINVYLNVIKDTSVSVINRELTEEASYLVNYCGGSIKNQYDAANPGVVSYSLLFVKNKDVKIDQNFKGFIFTTEDVIIEPGCNSINGMICAGGKVYVKDRNNQLQLRADANIMQSLIFDGFTENSNTAEWLQILFRVDPDSIDKDKESTGNIDEDKNLRNYNCSQDITTENYRKNVEYVGSH